MIRRILFVLLVVVIGAGCAGPKRFPALNTSITQSSVGSSERTYPIVLGVGLAEKQTVLQLQSNGKCLVLDGNDGRRLGTFAGGKVALVCQAQNGSFEYRWGDNQGQVSAIKLQPVDPETHVLYDGEEYKGEFLVILTPQSAGLTLINNVELETYLQGVLPWEIGRPGPEAQAALEAQAVAARTYTISKLGSRSARGFDLVATIYDQVYRGCKDEASQCNQAIEATSGVVMQYAGKEINAYYSSCCGGVNSQIEDVWPRDAVPYLRSHLDAANRSSEAFCSQSRYFQWQEKWTAHELEKILQKTLPEYLDYMNDPSRREWAGVIFTPRNSDSSPQEPGKLYALNIQKKTTSGRVGALEIDTAAGTYRVRGDRVRWVLVPAGGKSSILRSAFFEVKLQRQGNSLLSVTLGGRGYGHGLGMCQTGALAMARQGYLYRAILGHYYKGASLIDLRAVGLKNGS